MSGLRGRGLSCCLQWTALKSSICFRNESQFEADTGSLHEAMNMSNLTKNETYADSCVINTCTQCNKSSYVVSKLISDQLIHFVSTQCEWANERVRCAKFSLCT